MPTTGEVVISPLSSLQRLEEEKVESNVACLKNANQDKRSLNQDETLIDFIKNEKRPEDNSEILSIFLVLNTMIGSGILNQPQVFMKAGIVGALIMLCVSTLFIWLGLVTLVDCGCAHSKFDFSELGRHAFGKSGEYVVDASIVVTTFGALMSYIVVIGGVTSDLWISWGCRTAQPGCSVYFTSCLLVFVFVLPVCITRYLGHLATYSIYSICAIVSCVVFVIIAGPSFRADPATKMGSNNLQLYSGLGGFQQLGSIVFALNCASASFHTFISMKDRTREAWHRVATTSVLIGFLLLASMGLAGYLSFREATDGQILNSFIGHYADLFKVMLVCHLVL
jgi:sodium-coupled neutral amino acid transporter 11